ncbi:MAG: dTDP-4-dehydrorhamnose reductase [Pseudomonadota bacterium]|nr:dTDP-4-dehydrorhamnose reductase [Pseudomonadota bacterium]
MRIVVTGGPGQLVLSLIERGAARDAGGSFEVIAVGPPELDLSAPDDDRIYAVLAAERPDVIVNAAAHTAVDKAESERELAFAINAEGAGAVARAAARCGVPLVHVSTDYVFSGDKSAPYTEADAPAPTGVYGASKLAGEQAVLASGADAAILRTAWVYSPFGANFVKTMLRLAETRDELGVVADQRGNPTSALDLADAVLTVAANLKADAAPEMRGIFHATGSGEASWADFAQAIFAASSAQHGPSAKVKSITTAQYPTPARRPANSRLDCSLLAHIHGVRLPDWRDSTDAVVARLVHETFAGAK